MVVKRGVRAPGARGFPVGVPKAPRYFSICGKIAAKVSADAFEDAEIFFEGERCRFRGLLLRWFLGLRAREIENGHIGSQGPDGRENSRLHFWFF